MNIFKRKKPIVVDIPPRPEVLEFYPREALYGVKEPVIDSGKVFYPVGLWDDITTDYFDTRVEAQFICDHWNIPVKKCDKKLRAKRAKQIAARNKEIADWDAKYKNKAIRVEIK